jgi:peptidoglycan/xylan/chitin deacetylase (PgdA/CDA1 family)
VRLDRRELLAAGVAAALAACGRTRRGTLPPSPARLPSTPAPSPAPVSSAPPAGLPAFVRNGPRDRPAVALTFHGSGDLALTRALLDEAHGARLTVFAVGQWLAANPDVARWLRTGGHELANHTYTHPSLGRLPAAGVRAEIARCAGAITAASGGPGAWFRPSAMEVPNATVIREARRAGYPTVVGYDVDSRDFTDPGAATVYDVVARGVRAGSVVSLHLGHRGTVTALPRILGALRDKGLAVVTVSDLLG